MNKSRRLEGESWEKYIYRMKEERHKLLSRHEAGESLVSLSKELGINWFVLQRKISKARKERETAKAKEGK